MLGWNTTITFTRKTNVVVYNWSAGTPTITPIGEPAYLEIQAAGITVGTLSITGTAYDDSSISEVVSFPSPMSLISANQYKSVVALTPSWGTFLINITAANMQGAPISSDSDFGPYVCIIDVDNLQRVVNPPGGLSVPGILRGTNWMVYINAFHPQNGDYAITAKGYRGTVTHVFANPLPNTPHSWKFFIEEDQG